MADILYSDRVIPNYSGKTQEEFNREITDCLTLLVMQLRQNITELRKAVGIGSDQDKSGNQLSSMLDQLGAIGAVLYSKNQALEYAQKLTAMSNIGVLDELALKAPLPCTTNEGGGVVPLDGNSGQVLSSNGDGTTSWATPYSGGNELPDGGSAGQVLKTDGSGGVYWGTDETGSGGSGSPGTMICDSATGSMVSVNGDTVIVVARNAGLLPGFFDISCGTVRLNGNLEVKGSVVATGGCAQGPVNF